MSNNDFKDNVEELFAKAEDFIKTKTIFGDAIVLGDITLIPIMDLAVGVGSSAKRAANNADKNKKDAGALGASLIASAVLVIKDSNVQVINIKNQDSLNKLIDMAPGVISNISNFFSKDEENNEIEKKTEKDSTDKKYVDGIKRNELEEDI